MGFLLCDPALMMPPGTTAYDDFDFWQRLIEWSADSRVRLGANSLDLVSTIFEDLGWPLFDPPACPPALKRDAGRSLNRLLTRVRGDSATSPDAPTPSLAPSHIKGDLVEEAIGRDAAALSGQDLLGLATSAGHWTPSGTTVIFSPPPPETLELVCVPGALTPTQVDELVQEYFASRRLTIIGGINASSEMENLRSRFDLKATRMRWIEAEKGKTMPLDLLDSLRAEHDVVFCVTGHIGHSETYAVKHRCAALGVELRLVENQTEIIEILARDFARDTDA